MATSGTSNTTTVTTVSSGNPGTVMGMNVPTLSALPLTLPFSGIPNVPMAICALNSQQPLIAASQSATNSGQLPIGTDQAAQATTPGSILLVNVGGSANNNLAAALTQLVAGSNLMQQQQLALGTSAPSAPIQSTFQMANPSQGFPVGGNPSAPYIVGQTSQMTGAAALQQVNLQAPGNMHQVQTLPTQIPVAPQQIQQQPSTPTAFMLVPIPQMQSVQNSAVNAASLINLGHQQQQQQVLLNQPHIIGSYPTNPTQLVHSSNSITSQPYPIQTVGSQQVVVTTPVQSNSTVPQSALQVLSVSSQPSTLPENKELKACLTGSNSGNVTVLNNVAQHTMLHPYYCSTSGQNHPASVAQSVQNQFQTLASLNTPVSATHLTTVAPSPACNQQQVPVTPPTTSAPFNSEVSSPGLAFLAQVSSLSSGQEFKTLSKDAQIAFSASLNPLMSPDVGESSESPITPRYEIRDNEGTGNPVNNNKVKQPVTELSESSLSRLCSTPTAMTVTSTTKLGDDSSTDMSIEHPLAIQSTETVVTDTSFTTSASTSLNAVITTSVTEPGTNQKRKKGPAPKLNGTEVCLICGDKASGFHYNVLSCEGCKGFFRRSVIKTAKYVCKGKGDCQMDLFMRRKCQQCRFQKCKSVGMKEESVLSEEQVKAKKMKKECDTSSNISTNSSTASAPDANIPNLTSQQRNLVELLKANERRFQWPTTEDMKKVTSWVEEDDSIHSRALRFAHFTELCILIVQLVVEFTKQLPGFLTVLREDQIVLLKSCAIEVMLLRAAKQYNKADGTINFLNGKLYDKSSFYRAGMQVEFVDPIFEFCNSMAQLELDETEYAILVAIITFSTDRPHIKDIEKVERMQDPYVELLRVYSRIRHPNDPLMFARILMKLVELRTLNNYHSEQIFALKVQDRKLPPLLAEIWDM